MSFVQQGACLLGPVQGNNGAVAHQASQRSIANPSSTSLYGFAASSYRAARCGRTTLDPARAACRRVTRVPPRAPPPAATPDPAASDGFPADEEQAADTQVAPTHINAVAGPLQRRPCMTDMLLHNDEAPSAASDAHGRTAAHGRAEHASTSFLQNVLQRGRHPGAARPHQGGPQQHRADTDGEPSAAKAKGRARKVTAAGDSDAQQPASRRQQRMLAWLDQDDTLDFDFWGRRPGTATVPSAATAAVEQVQQPEGALAVAAAASATFSGRSPSGNTNASVGASLQGGSSRGGRLLSTSLPLAAAAGQAACVSPGSSPGGVRGGRGSGRSPGELGRRSSGASGRSGAVARGAVGDGASGGGDSGASRGGGEKAGGAGAGGSDWRALLADGADRRFLTSLLDPVDALFDEDAAALRVARSSKVRTLTAKQANSAAWEESEIEIAALPKRARRRSQKAQEYANGNLQEGDGGTGVSGPAAAATASRQRGRRQPQEPQERQQEWQVYELAAQVQGAQEGQQGDDEEQPATDWQGPRMDNAWQRELGWAPGGATAAARESAEGAAGTSGQPRLPLDVADEEGWGSYIDSETPAQLLDGAAPTSGPGGGMLRGWRDATRGGARTAAAAAARGAAGLTPWGPDVDWGRWDEDGAPGAFAGNTDLQEPARSGRGGGGGYLPSPGPARASSDGGRRGGKAAALRAEGELRRNAAMVSAGIPRKGASVAFWLPTAPAVATTAAAAAAAAEADAAVGAAAPAAALVAKCAPAVASAASGRGQRRLLASGSDAAEDDDSEASAGTDVEAAEFVREAEHVAAERAAAAQAAAAAAAAEAESDTTLWARIPLQYNFAPIFKILEMDRADSMPQPIPTPPELLQLAEELCSVVLASSSSSSKGASSSSSSTGGEGLLRPGGDTRDPAAARELAAEPGTQGKGRAKGKPASARRAAAALLSGVTAYAMAGGVEVLLVQDARALRPAIAWLRQSLGDDAVAGVDSEWPAMFANSGGSSSGSSSSSSSASIRAAAAASEKLSLLQLASPTRVLLLHLVCMDGGALDPLYGLLADPVLTWVASGWSRSEAARLARTLGGPPPPMRVLDVQAAAAAAGWHRVGLASLANEVLGAAGFVKHRKVTTSNWARPDLNERQVRYAALDALVPPMLLRQLRLFAAFPGLRCTFCKHELHAPEGVQQRPPRPSPRQQQDLPLPAPAAPDCSCEHCGRTLWSTLQLVAAPGATAAAAAAKAMPPPHPAAAAGEATASGAGAVSPGGDASRTGTSSPGGRGNGSGGGGGGLTEYLLRVAARGQQRLQGYSMSGGTLRRPRQRLFSQDGDGDGGGGVEGSVEETSVATDTSALQSADEGTAAGSSASSSGGAGVGKKKKKKAVKAAAAAVRRRLKGEGDGAGASSTGASSSSSSSSSSARQQALWELWESGSPAAAAAVALAMAPSENGSETDGAGGSGAGGGGAVSA